MLHLFPERQAIGKVSENSRKQYNLKKNLNKVMPVSEVMLIQISRPEKE